MPGPPYYGNPAALKVLNRNVESFAGDKAQDFDGQVQIYDEILLPAMLGRLAGRFTSLPAPTNKQATILSTLWAYGMSALIQPAKKSATPSGQSGSNKSGVGSTWEERYETLMKQILRGEIPVDGATAGGVGPSSRAGMPERTTYSEGPTEPVEIDRVFQHGNRLGGPGITQP